MRRRGFALLVVLWVLALAAGLGLTADSGSRDGIDASNNRATLLVARAQAHGCAALGFSAVVDAVEREEEGSQAIAWSRLEDVTPALSQLAAPDCTLRIEPEAIRANINALDEESLAALLSATPTAGDVQVAAASIIAFRTTHGPFRAPEQLLLVPGLEGRVRFCDFLSTEEGPIDIMHASEAVLRALPGIDATLARAIVAKRVSGWRPQDLRAISALADGNGAISIGARYVDLERIAVLVPPAWTLMATALTGRAGLDREERWTIVRGDGGLRVSRRSTR